MSYDVCERCDGEGCRSCSGKGFTPTHPSTLATPASSLDCWPADMGELVASGVDWRRAKVSPNGDGDGSREPVERVEVTIQYPRHPLKLRRVRYGSLAQALRDAMAWEL
jgi:hypothetical protein